MVTPQKSDMKRAMLLLALMLCGCGGAEPQAHPSPSPSPSPALQAFAISGAITLGSTDYDSEADGSCVGTGGYDDLQPGGQVVVTDPAGTTVAVGQITDGQVEEDDNGIHSCRLTFQVTDVPAGKKFYGVEVTNRGRLQYSEDEVQRTHLELSIG